MAQMAGAYEDNFEIARAIGFGQNAAYEGRLKKLRLWQQFMHAHGVPYKIDYLIDILKDPEPILAEDDIDESIRKRDVNQKHMLEMDKNPSVFLPKYMTGLSIAVPAGAEQGDYFALDESHDFQDIPQNIRTGAHYQDLIIEHYEGRFILHGAKGRMNSTHAQTDEKYLNLILFENIKGAMILAQNAKAAGWEEVNFGNTTDPARRMALQAACDYLGLKVVGEKVDPSALPQNTFHKEKLANMITASLNEFRPSFGLAIWPHVNTQELPLYSPPQNNTDSWGDDLDALMGPTPN